MGKKLEAIADTGIWAKLDSVLPIDGFELGGFKAWVNWNGSEGTRDHRITKAFDFAAYLTNDGRCILGLPEGTRVRAVADGIVRQVRRGTLTDDDGYIEHISIEHCYDGSGIFSAYGHVISAVKPGRLVRKGEVIGNLYKDLSTKTGRLVHLHLQFMKGWNSPDRFVDPASVFPQIQYIKAVPQASPHFRIPTEPSLTYIIANFEHLRVSGKIWS